MANLSQYYPNPIVAGTTPGTYADGGSAAFRDRTLPFTADQIFSTTNNTAPNQTAASGSSLMTRGLIDERKWNGGGAKVFQITNFGASYTIGSGTTIQAFGNYLLLRTSQNGSVASTSCANTGGAFPLIGLHGDSASGGYGGYSFVRDILWDITLGLMATPAASVGVLRVGTNNVNSALSFIERVAWQLRIEWTGSATQLRLCTAVGSSTNGTNFGAITNCTNASPIVVTTGTHGLSNGDQVEIGEVLGNTAANGIWTIANVTTTTFELVGSTGNGAYTSGGQVARCSNVLLTGVGPAFRAFVRANAGTISLVLGEDPTATPAASQPNSPTVNYGRGGTLQTHLQQNGTTAMGFSGFTIGPINVAVR